MADIHDNIRYLKGVGETRAKALERLGVRTVEDMANYFPRTYEDRRALYAIMDAPLDRPVCVKASVTSPPLLHPVRKGLNTLRFRAADDSGALDITYFNQPYLKNTFRLGETYIFYGRVAETGRWRNMTNPAYEAAEQQGSVTGRLLPVYRLTSGVGQRFVRDTVAIVLREYGRDLPDILPPALREQHHLAQARYAYENIHFPRSDQALDQARRRLVFEELFTLSAALSMMRGQRTTGQGKKLTAYPMDEFWASLPFQPTNAQRRAFQDAMADMTSGIPMSRLLQGDVGSGKTLVAAALIYQAAKNGLQSALMAPTEILADQHFATLSDILARHNIRIVRLTGSMTAAQKRNVYEILRLGMADVAVGTHALLGEKVTFADLGLVITDEQHRFGVEQRGVLSGKGDRPHVLVMSATPIPRTLALIIYGELDISVLDELPPGRQKVDTFVLGENMRERIWNFVRRLVGEGRQVFIVCPVVGDSEELAPDVKSAEAWAAVLQKDVFPDLRVACIHGKMKSRDKDAAMSDFAGGAYDLLVSTTVIEVGVDVPNAALMIVENADRFGLSQLHQLRGRVGRGQHKSYCVLFSNAESDDAKARLSVLKKTSDGFQIAEEDLRLRGPGDFFGSRQHGLPDMHLADLSADMCVLNEAQGAAQAVLAADPTLSREENRPLRVRMGQLFERYADTLN